MAYAGTQAQQVLWAKQNQAAADYAKIPREIEWGVYGMETNFGRYIGTSSAGARGLMQFIQATAQQWHYPYTDYPDKSQSQDQFTAGALYLRQLFRGARSWDLAIRGYSGNGYNLADVEAKATSFNPPSGGSFLVGGSPYSNFGRASSISRVDDGIDMTLTEAASALADGKVLWWSANQWHPWGAFMSLSIDDGPRKGWNYYIAEGIMPVRRIGDHVKRGDIIAQRATNGGNGIVGNIEAGWAGFRNVRDTLAQERGHGGEVPSPEGNDFKGFYLGLGSGDLGGSGSPLVVDSGNLGSMFERYNWSGDIYAALRGINREADTGYSYSQQARREVLHINTFTTTGGR